MIYGYFSPPITTEWVGARWMHTHNLRIVGCQDMPIRIRGHPSITCNMTFYFSSAMERMTLYMQDRSLSHTCSLVFYRKPTTWGVCYLCQSNTAVHKTPQFQLKRCCMEIFPHFLGAIFCSWRARRWEFHTKHCLSTHPSHWWHTSPTLSVTKCYKDNVSKQPAMYMQISLGKYVIVTGGEYT